MKEIRLRYQRDTGVALPEDLSFLMQKHLLLYIRWLEEKFENIYKTTGRRLDDFSDEELFRTGGGSQ